MVKGLSDSRLLVSSGRVRVFTQFLTINLHISVHKAGYFGEGSNQGRIGEKRFLYAYEIVQDSAKT